MTQGLPREQVGHQILPRLNSPPSKITNGFVI